MVPLFGGYWLPSGAALGYVYILNRWQTEMADTLATGVDPFKATSMLPTVAFTALYLTVVFVTRKFLKDRPAYDCKPYMAVYNLYQVRSCCQLPVLPFTELASGTATLHSNLKRTANFQTSLSMQQYLAPCCQAWVFAVSLSRLSYLLCDDSAIFFVMIYLC